MRDKSRTHGIDGALKDHDVDVLLGPGSGPLYMLAAAAAGKISGYRNPMTALLIISQVILLQLYLCRIWTATDAHLVWWRWHRLIRRHS